MDKMRNEKMDDERSAVFFDLEKKDLLVARNQKEAWFVREVDERAYVDLGFRTNLEIKLMKLEIQRGTFEWEEWKL